jgi:hypothetical protein
MLRALPSDCRCLPSHCFATGPCATVLILYRYLIHTKSASILQSVHIYLWFFKVLQQMKNPVSWDTALCSPLKVNRIIGCSVLLATCFVLVSHLVYSSTLKRGATCFSEASVEFQRSTRRYIPEDRTVHNHRCDSLKSYICNNHWFNIAIFYWILFIIWSIYNIITKFWELVSPASSSDWFFVYENKKE